MEGARRLGGSGVYATHQHLKHTRVRMLPPHTIRHAAVDELIAITWATAATVSTAHQVRRGASTSADTRSALGAQTRPIGAF